jgi:hypothetical protein
LGRAVWSPNPLDVREPPRVDLVLLDLDVAVVVDAQGCSGVDLALAPAEVAELERSRPSARPRRLDNTAP